MDVDVDLVVVVDLDGDGGVDLVVRSLTIAEGARALGGCGHSVVAMLMNPQT